MKLELSTDRLFLRPLQLDDLDLALEMFTDPEVMHYVGGPQTVEKIETEIHKKIKRCGGGCIGTWCVIDRHTSEKLGTGILLPIPIDKNHIDWDLVEGPDIPDSEIEVGYILKRSAWGKGYATEICQRLLTFAFEETPLTEIVACIDDNNEKSRRVLLKCGMTEEGKKQAYNDQLPWFRITKEQWLS